MSCQPNHTGSPQDDAGYGVQSGQLSADVWTLFVAVVWVTWLGSWLVGRDGKGKQSWKLFSSAAIILIHFVAGVCWMADLGEWGDRWNCLDLLCGRCVPVVCLSRTGSGSKWRTDFPFDYFSTRFTKLYISQGFKNRCTDIGRFKNTSPFLDLCPPSKQQK